MKKTKELVVTTTDQSNKRKAVWLGAQQLMNKPGDQKEAGERNIVLLTSRVAKVSPFGVNILGNLPYLNKIGLGQKAKQIEPKVWYEYNWIQRALDDTGKAIVECRLMNGNKPLCGWITGECSPSSMKMGTLKGYQNHMAQTRAKNRAILETYGIDIHEEMMENLGILQDSKLISANEAKKIGAGTAASAEEINDKPETDVQPDSVREKLIIDICDMAATHEVTAGQELKWVEQKIGRTIDWNNCTSKQLETIKLTLRSIITKQNDTN